MKFTLCFKFCLEVIYKRFKFLCTLCATDLGMLGQIIHYGKMGGNLLQHTWNKEMPIVKDQMEVRAKLIFTHIIQDGLNRVSWLSLWLRVKVVRVEKAVKELAYWAQHHTVTGSDKVTTELRCRRQLKKRKRNSKNHKSGWRNLMCNTN